MAPLLILVSALLLALERIWYFFAWRRPQAFARWAARVHIASDGVTALERFFYLFKAIQLGVCGYWAIHFSEAGWLSFSASVPAIVGGILLLVGGQLLNFFAMLRLGRAGTFYGIRFGVPVPRCTRFPYNLIDHPQYVGAVATIWGFFLLTRFPHADWLVLPCIETAYYLVGARLENDRVVRVEPVTARARAADVAADVAADAE